MVDGPRPHEADQDTDFHERDFAVALVEPRTLIRDSLQRSLSANGAGITVIAGATIAECLEMIDPRGSLAVIIMCAPRMKPIDDHLAVRLARVSESGEVPPTVLMADREEPEEIIKAIEGGAKGYIPTSVPLDVAVEALRLVRAGGTYLPVSTLLSSRGGAIGQGRARRTVLFTPRQLDVVDGLRQGKSNKRIANDLQMRESTVKVHVRNIMRKLKARNRTEVAYLTRELFREED